ncbi:MAG: hypothetical protein QXJ82_05390, partial [Nitrososphaerota archaeon]
RVLEDRATKLYDHYIFHRHDLPPKLLKHRKEKMASERGVRLAIAIIAVAGREEKAIPHVRRLSLVICIHVGYLNVSNIRKIHVIIAIMLPAKTSKRLYLRIQLGVVGFRKGGSASVHV